MMGVGGRGTEATVLLKFARLFTPLHKGRGKPRSGAGEGLLLRGGAFCIFMQFYTPFRCVFRNPSNYSLKALVLGRESMGFRA